MKRFLLVLFVMLASAVALAACGADDEDAGSADTAATQADAKPAETGPITIGMAASLSGPISAYDGPIKEAIELGIKDVNAKGGVAGRKLELVTADNKTDLQLVKSTAERVLGQGTDIFVPTCDYDIGGPAAKLANDRGKIAITCAGSPLWGREGLGENVYNTYQATPTEAAAIASFVAKRGWKRPYVITDTTLEYTKNLSQYFEQVLPQYAGDAKVAGKDSFQNPDTSIASQVTRLKNSDADVVVLSSYLPGGATALKQLRAGGVDLPVVGGIAFDGGPVWTKAIPGLSDFYYTGIVSMFGDDPDDAVNAFYARFKKETGAVPPSSLSVTGYDTVQTIARAIEGAKGSTDAAALRKQLNAFKDVPLLAGPTTYTEECHIPVGRPMRIIGIDGGKASFLETAETPKLPEAPC